MNQRLDQELRVIVTRDGTPQAGVTVAWTTGDGSLDRSTEETKDDGISTAAWTLGANAGAQTARAEVAGATGSPVVFAATATASQPPPPSPAATRPSYEHRGDRGNDFFRSGSAKSYSFRFTQAGTYTYDCAVHGSG
ncbi:MAG TPA: hypothetical protein VH763_04915 [Gemmatimonadales bacterium]